MPAQQPAGDQPQTLVLPFQIGQIVYHKVSLSDEGRPDRGIVTGVLVRPTSIMFYVTWTSHRETLHYDLELLPEPPEPEFTSTPSN
jgi:hypothetical protein